MRKEIKTFNSAGLPKWQTDIINTYPLIYKTPNPNLQQWYPGTKYLELIETPDFCNLRYGFEFNEGWKDLVIEFSDMAYWILDKVKYEYPNEFRHEEYYIKSCVFKSKFGQLRWQGDSRLPKPYDKIFNQHISYIEEKSLTICEESGEKGKIRKSRGVVKTLSDKMVEKLKFN